MNRYDLGSLKKTFKSVGIKIVSKTDINKDAYVVTAKQRDVLKKAGFRPGIYPEVATISLCLFGTGEVVEASYYGSQRTGSGRTPEYRMGRFLDRVNVGDKIAFATDGKDVFICNIASSGTGIKDTGKAYEEASIIANEKLPLNELIKRALKAKRKPAQQKITTTTYNRDSAVIALAHRRSGYKCEMPGCNYIGFKKYNGGKFIETHHIKPLSEKGDDSISNVAALCPNCHKKAHHSKTRNQLTTELRKVVQRSNRKMGI